MAHLEPCVAAPFAGENLWPLFPRTACMPGLTVGLAGRVHACGARKQRPDHRQPLFMLLLLPVCKGQNKGRQWSGLCFLVPHACPACPTGKPGMHMHARSRLALQASQACMRCEETKARDFHRRISIFRESCKKMIARWQFTCMGYEPIVNQPWIPPPSQKFSGLFNREEVLWFFKKFNMG